MVNDIWTSVKAYLYDRTSSPLLGALVIGWIAWNFKILMLFFSKADYAEKIWEIDHYYEQTFLLFRSFGLEHWLLSNHVFCLFVMPILTALFYIYVFPWFSHRVFEHSYNKQIALNNKKKEIQGSDVMTADEKAEILSMYETAKLEARELVAKHRQELERLESQLQTLVHEKNDYKQEVDQLRTLLSEKEKELKEHSPSRNAMAEAFAATRESRAPVDTDLPLKEQEDNKVRYVSNLTSPQFVKFYEKLNMDSQIVTDKVISLLLNNSLSFQEMCQEIIYEPDMEPLLDESAFKKLISKLMLYDLIDKDFDSLGEAYYVLTSEGKSLYKHILETEDA